MKAEARNLERIFDGTVSFQIPLFQRPYVWKKENWEPLWEDIYDLLDKNLSDGFKRPHFMGAVVLEQLKSKTGSIETRQVIDGQQRFTTLQIFMIAARDLCKEHGDEKNFDRFNDLVSNKKSKVDHDYEVFKIWPTNRDRAAFEAIHRAGSITNLEDIIKTDTDSYKDSKQLIEGYKFFTEMLQKWLTEEPENNKVYDIETRLDALWQVVKMDLKLVVIDLDDDDESQVIFETLNARGTQLLPADLIKNYLFRRAQSEAHDIDILHNRYWKDFESDFWRKEIKQGRIKRPRIDLFFQHYLTLMMREEVKIAHLFDSFKQYTQDIEGEAATANQSVEQHLIKMNSYSKAFKVFSEPPPNSRLALFMKRLDAIDTATVYPLLLLAFQKLHQEERHEFDRFLNVLESYLVRRMVCGLTTKNYNRLFVDSIRYLNKANSVTASTLESFLKAGEGESTRFPSDVEFKEALINRPLYNLLSKYKLRTVLEALDMQSAVTKSEAIALPDGLTIEHILPQKWLEKWSIPVEIDNHPEDRIQFINQRNKLVHTIGNLTLITGSLNPAISNDRWPIKRPELMKYSKLNLNRYFHEDNLANTWNESTILNRSKFLSDLALKVWP